MSNGSSVRAQTDGRTDRQTDATKCIISLTSRSIIIWYLTIWRNISNNTRDKAPLERVYYLRDLILLLPDFIHILTVLQMTSSYRDVLEVDVFHSLAADVEQNWHRLSTSDMDSQMFNPCLLFLTLLSKDLFIMNSRAALCTSTHISSFFF